MKGIKTSSISVFIAQSLYCRLVIDQRVIDQMIDDRDIVHDRSLLSFDRSRTIIFFHENIFTERVIYKTFGIARIKSLLKPFETTGVLKLFNVKLEEQVFTIVIRK
jgi:hypothetical protein